MIATMAEVLEAWRLSSEAWLFMFAAVFCEPAWEKASVARQASALAKKKRRSAAKLISGFRGTFLKKSP
jgi:hypothetical protein